MCRALRVLCAAPDAASLQALKQAAVSQAWEFVGGATSAEDAIAQVGEWEPDVLVFFGVLATDLTARAREVEPLIRTVVIGPGDADAQVIRVEEVKVAIAGLDRPPGPIR